MNVIRASAIITGSLGVVLLTGCGGHDPRSEVPGHLEPGPVPSIVSQMHGAGDDNAIERMGKAPIGGYVPPNVAFMNDPELAYIWFDERISKDGESLRFGHWAAVKVRESSFLQEDLQSDAMYLNGLDEIEIGPDGQIHGKVIGRVAPVANTDRATNPAGPWNTNGKDTKMTVVLDDGAGPPRIVGDGVIQNNGAGALDPARMRDMVNNLQNRIGAQNGQGNPTSAGVQAPTNGVAPTTVTPPASGTGAGRTP